MPRRSRTFRRGHVEVLVAQLAHDPALLEVGVQAHLRDHVVEVAGDRIKRHKFA